MTKLSRGDRAFWTAMRLAVAATVLWLCLIGGWAVWGFLLRVWRWFH